MNKTHFNNTTERSMIPGPDGSQIFAYATDMVVLEHTARQMAAEHILLPWVKRVEVDKYAIGGITKHFVKGEIDFKTYSKSK